MFGNRAEFSFQDAIGPSAEFSFVGQDGGNAALKQRAAAAAIGAELAQQPMQYAPGQYFQASPDVFSGMGAVPAGPEGPTWVGNFVKGLAVGGVLIGLMKVFGPKKRRGFGGKRRRASK